MTSFSGLRCLVVGLGSSGEAAARALIARGARVAVTEAGSSERIQERAETLRRSGARVETGGHTLEGLDFDLAIVSPGVPPASAIMRALRAAGVDVISEVELAWRLARCDFLAITGTNGKSTATALLARILDAAGIPSVAAGNIGFPLVEAIDQVPAEGAIAVEVSSFQLEGTRSFRPRVAVVLNVAEDHLDWHGSFESYARAKARIVLNQRREDFCVANQEDAIAVDIARQGNGRTLYFSARRDVPGGAGVRDGHITWRGHSLMDRRDVPLSGEGGLEDALAAASAALCYGVEPEAVVEGIVSFRPLAHRMQVVAQIDGVTYIDDSKATNPHATLGDVRGLNDVVLIAGGRAKGADLSTLRGAVPAVHAVVAIGESAEEVARVFEQLVPVERALSMEDAVMQARGLARVGGSVLLAPACASLDMYEDFHERGDHFARVVGALAGRNHSHA